MDPRIRTLARTLIRYSTDLQPGEKILIDLVGLHQEIGIALVQEAYAVGGVPFVSIKDERIRRALLLGVTTEQWDAMARYELARLQDMQAYISIRGAENTSEWADVPAEKQAIYQRNWWHPVHQQRRIKHTKWVVLRWPTPNMAQLAGTSTDSFTDFYFDVCTLDYAKMSAAMDALKDLLDRTDRVQVKGPDTDLRFSIKGIGSVKCAGQRNIPDGECYTAPVRDSVQGVVSFNTPSVYQGTTFERVRFEFRDGQIVKATANDDARVNAVLDTDAGARYIGEFSLGFNPFILQPMKDTLFDEKIAGSFHFTPGQAYEEAWNGNHSAIHWDLVCIQRPEYGGGEIWFDGRLIRQDGRFVVPELEPLNPENLR